MFKPGFETLLDLSSRSDLTMRGDAGCDNDPCDNIPCDDPCDCFDSDGCQNCDCDKG